MAREDPVVALAELARTFGAAAARRKRDLLARLAATPRVAPARLALLQETLLFLLAYPDDRRVLEAARAQVARLRGLVRAALERAGAAGEEALRDSGLPGTAMVDTYGFPLLLRLRRLFPGALEIDWDEEPDTGKLQAAVVQLLLGAEVPGLDDITLDWDDWLAACRPEAPAAERPRDLDLLLDLFERAPLRPTDREWRFDGCELPVRWRLDRIGSARGELLAPVARPHFQRRAPAPSAVAFETLVRAPLADPGRLSRREGERFLDLAAAALAVRQSEIRPLSYGNPEDVTRVACGSGLVVALVGAVPGYREALESLTTVLLLKNGVPIAYGPASVSAGCCELGLNLFDEFRGVETRWLYAQYLRVVHHVLGARAFFLTPYGMGVGNPDALRAGSFWFYRRLGFRPSNPEVEALARAEEARLARTRGARSDLRTLRRLAETSAWLHLARGGHRSTRAGPDRAGGHAPHRARARRRSRAGAAARRGSRGAGARAAEGGGSACAARTGAGAGPGARASHAERTARPRRLRAREGGPLGGRRRCSTPGLPGLAGGPTARRRPGGLKPERGFLTRDGRRIGSTRVARSRSPQPAPLRTHGVELESACGRAIACVADRFLPSQSSRTSASRRCGWRINHRTEESPSRPEAGEGSRENPGSRARPRALDSPFASIGQRR